LGSVSGQKWGWEVNAPYMVLGPLVTNSGYMIIFNLKEQSGYIQGFDPITGKNAWNFSLPAPSSGLSDCGNNLIVPLLDQDRNVLLIDPINGNVISKWTSITGQIVSLGDFVVQADTNNADVWTMNTYTCEGEEVATNIVVNSTVPSPFRSEFELIATGGPLDPIIVLIQVFWANETEIEFWGTIIVKASSSASTRYNYPLGYNFSPVWETNGNILADNILMLTAQNETGNILVGINVDTGKFWIINKLGPNFDFVSNLSPDNTTMYFPSGIPQMAVTVKTGEIVWQNSNTSQMLYTTLLQGGTIWGFNYESQLVNMNLNGEIISVTSIHGTTPYWLISSRGALPDNVLISTSRKNKFSAADAFGIINV